MSLALLLLACAYTPEDFAEEHREALCDRMAECRGRILNQYSELGLHTGEADGVYEDTYRSDCEVEAPLVVPDCEVTRRAARRCFRDIAEMKCRYFTTGNNYPERCSQACEVEE